MNSSILSPIRHAFSVSNLIPKRLIDYLCADCQRFRIFDPSTTLYCFIFQVLNTCSCKVALANLNLQRAKIGYKMISMNTAAYTKAKQRLSEEKLKFIATSLGQDSDPNCKFNGRDVLLGDGSILNLEDSKTLRKEYPAARRLGKIQGTPKMRLMALFNANSGKFVEGEIGKYCGKGQGETSLLRALIPKVNKDAILVLDRFFTNFFVQWELRSRSIDYVIRARDKVGKKELKRKSDITSILKKPYSFDKNNLTEVSAPKEFRVRYIRSKFSRKGFRCISIYIVTNLFKEDGYSKQDIEQLYLKRWAAEVDFRHLKETLDASMLRSKSPSQARKELWVHLIAFNIIRTLNSFSASRNGYSPQKQAFKLCSKTFLMAVIHGGVENTKMMFEILKNEFLNSKYRAEPRAVKQHNNRYPKLHCSRKEARKILQKGGQEGFLKMEAA